MTLEGGKPLIENSDEVGWTAAAFDYYAEMGRNFAGRVIPSIESTQLALVLKEPMGVVGAIVPWNYPLLLLSWKLAPALAAGNTVVCKPSELTPLSTLMLAPCLEPLPPGVVALLAGAGDVGEAIVADERVDCVAFTGSVETGKRIAARCAERVARINLEMGGKDPFIVCADVAGRRGGGRPRRRLGRVPERRAGVHVGRALLRAREVYDDFLQAFVDHTGSLRGRRPARRRHRRRPDGLGRAAREGGRPGGGRGGRRRRAGGRAATAPARRAATSTRPAVVTGAPAETDLLREETFGPVAPIVPVASLDEAIELANGTRFGLGANVYTRDLETAVRCMREIKAGTVWINDPLTDNDAGPFGGFKQSGLGRELGQEGLEAFQETKHVHIETKIAPKEWWYPYGGGGPADGAGA